MTPQPRTLALGGIALSALLALGACSSGSDSSSSSASSSASANPSSSVAPIPALSSACASVYEVDLLVSDYNAGAVANGDFTEAEAVADYRRLTKAINTSAKAVKDVGQASTLKTNSAKSLKTLNGLSKKATLSTMAAKKAKKLATQRTRMIKACTAAGYPLPAVNAQAHLDVTPTASSAKS